MAFDIGAAVAHIKLDLDEFKKGLNEAHSQADGFGSKLSSVGAGLADIGQKAAIFTGVVAAGAGLIGKYALDGAAKFEQYQIAYTTLLGSQEKAAEAIKNIQKDAAQTPFELSPLVMANQRLISAGVNAEDARADILNLGDAISATGGGNAELERLSTNLQQIKAVGKASALDIKQFAFAGINIYDMLAKSTGKSVAEVKEMDVSYEVLADSFDKAAGKGGKFHDAMKNQSMTLNGLMSTLKDTVSLGLKDILMQSGAFDSIRNSVAALIPFLNDAVPKVVAFFQGIPKDPTFIAVMNALTTAFTVFGAWIAEHQELVMVFLQGLAVGLGALLVIGTITGLLTLLLNPLTLIVLGIAALYTAWSTNFLGIRDITNAVCTEMVNFFNNYLMPAIQVLMDYVSANWQYWVLMTQGTFEIITGIIQMAWAVIYTIIKVALALISGDFDAAWKAITDGIDMFFGGFTKVLQGAIDYIRGWGGQLVSNLVQPFQDAWNKISDFLTKIKDGLDFTKRHSPSVVDIVRTGVTKVNSALDNLNLNSDFSPQQVAGVGIAGNTGNTFGAISINIDMSGAMLGDAFSAQRMGQKVGDSIVKRLQQNVRF